MRCAGAPVRLLAALSVLRAAVPAHAAAGNALLPGSSAVAAAPVPLVAPSSTAADTAHCVDSRSLDLRRILPPPPPARSPRERAELDPLLRIQARRTASEAALARRDAVRSIFRFADALGDAPGFDARKLPRTLAPFHHLDTDEIAVLVPAKHEFARARPFAVEPRLAPIVGRPASGSIRAQSHRRGRALSERH